MDTSTANTQSEPATAAQTVPALELIDYYAAHAISGILAAGGYPSAADSLAENAFNVGAAMLRERKKYLQQASTPSSEG